MKLLSAKPEYWDDRFGNYPGLVVTVDKLPEHDTLVYEHDGHGHFFAQTADGYVSFKYANGPFTMGPQGIRLTYPDQGYGGRHFHIKAHERGSTEIQEWVLRGPWSSNSHSSKVAGFPDSVETVLIETEGEYPTLGYACALTLAAWCKALVLASPLPGTQQFGFAAGFDGSFYFPIEVKRKELWGRVFDLRDPVKNLTFEDIDGQQSRIATS